ncbi:hypothetical protein AB6H26_06740 [Providencia hangzhouensis]|uniref:Uncharacterized protein n=2 Tax=Morganellaceae TaxID=1903414 RepID=A0A9N8D2Y4_PRORE|nr:MULTISPECIES: hypothetical protein [Providencia]MBG5891013.1 hypothetical protein [Providencia rettgeri]WOB89290.1 hypothetical protein P3L44_11160 [Providencia sp. PROV175]CAB5647554.1 Uncharacterised protein [Providencia rettgeri]CAB5691986.1 Uncharacterised protein [Providencia rettgeri]CAC9181494.1 Uncharacterised protein [Providencia rettgeri]
MSTKVRIKQIKTMIKQYGVTGENADSMVIKAIMDEIAGTKPDGTADKIAEQLHKRTGYTFPASEELKQLFSSRPDSTKEQGDNTAEIIVKS